MGEKNKLFNKQEVQYSFVIDKLVKESSPRKTYLMMIFISSVIATLGLLHDSASITIGAMLVAPLLWPVIGFGMGLVVMDWRMMRLSFISVLLSILVALGTSILITFFYIPLGASREILIQTDWTFMIPVAICAGIAAAFALCYESIKEAVTGVAISVALLPPLVAIGIGLGATDWHLTQRALELFSINLVCIIASGVLIFSILGFTKFKKTVDAATKKEEKVLSSE
ncbi:TIGR00341 family protein [Patescibacteria group bacterium]|nr:TIGR00341 family protein [Patescibacteria group bacterium]